MSFGVCDFKQEMKAILVNFNRLLTNFTKEKKYKSRISEPYLKGQKHQRRIDT
jgi:hypothetical protein